MTHPKTDPSDAAGTIIQHECPYLPDELCESSGTDKKTGQEVTWSKDEERKSIVKLDLIVMPLVSLFYFFSNLDRSNIGNARVAGLQSDLKLSDHQYSLVISLTQITYVLIEVPANLVLKRIGATIFLPMISFSWGLVTFLQGFVTNFWGLAITRLLMGLCEGGLYPGILLYLSQSYSRDQIQMRTAIVYSTLALSGGFSGLLAYAILHIDGALGKPDWAWLFFVEGGTTMTFAIIIAFIFPASINCNRWLNQREKDILTTRLLRKSPSEIDENEKFDWSEIMAAIKSPHVLILTVTSFLTGTATGSLAFFTPTIVHSLGYSPTRTQLMTSPPFVVAFMVMIATSWLSDRYQARALTAGLGAALGFVGFLIFLLAEPSNIHAKYGSLFLSIPGVYSITPSVSAWSANNSIGHYRRAVAIALTFSTSPIGATASTWLFPNSQSPRYRPGIFVNLLCCAGVIIGVTLNFLWLRYATEYKFTNRDKILEPYGSDGGTANTAEHRRAWRELGDKHPDFYYLY